MEKKELAAIRHRLGKTQKEISQLLGISLKAIKSYEQGWRKVPVYIERQILFLLALKEGCYENKRPCWTIIKCPMEIRKKCPAWEFKTGHLCWFISGTLCHGEVQENWHEKIRICRQCKMFQQVIANITEEIPPEI